MKMKTIEVFDVMPIAPWNGAFPNAWNSIETFVSTVKESNPTYSICNPNDLLEGVEPTTKHQEVLRILVPYLSNARGIVTLAGWETDATCQALVAIARQMKIPVLSYELVKHQISNGTEWISYN